MMPGGCWAPCGVSDYDADSSSDDYSSYDDSTEDSSSGEEAKSNLDLSSSPSHQHITNRLRQYMDMRDYVLIQPEFDELILVMRDQQYETAAASRISTTRRRVPRSLVRILVDLEDHLSLSPRQGRTMKKLKATIRKKTKPYRRIMDSYRDEQLLEATSASSIMQNFDLQSCTADGSDYSSSDRLSDNGLNRPGITRSRSFHRTKLQSQGVTRRKARRASQGNEDGSSDSGICSFVAENDLGGLSAQQTSSPLAVLTCAGHDGAVGEIEVTLTVQASVHTNIGDDAK